MTRKEELEVDEIVFGSFVDEVRVMLRRVREHYAKHQSVPDVCLLWPNRTIKSESGKPIDGVCALSLETIPTEERKQRAMQNATIRCEAFCVLRVRLVNDEAVAILESREHNRSWHMKTEVHGDLRMLSEPVECNGLEHLSVFSGSVG